MEEIKKIPVKQYLLKIVGLLGDYPQKNGKSFQEQLIRKGYREKEPDSGLKRILKDSYYKEFRQIMFEKPDNLSSGELPSRRFVYDCNDTLSFIREPWVGKVTVTRSEVFFFAEEIALFALTIRILPEDQHLHFFSDLIFQVRKFNSTMQVEINGTQSTIEWHECISKKYLAGTILRSDKEHIKSDDYSGSKFKVFSVFDCDLSVEKRDGMLYDMGTCSIIGSGGGTGKDAPHPQYYQSVLENKISYFNNWESLCLFDSFTTIGNEVLTSPYENIATGKMDTWQDTYFRIYLFRLFFKYNLFRYNTELHDNTIKLRNRFEKFLNDYQLHQISFNFLPNEMFNKIGNGLNLNDELSTFRDRINAISNAIQEEKQSRMNLLLQGVTAISALSSIQPIIDALSKAQAFLGWSNMQFYIILTIVLITLATAVFYFLFTDTFKKLIKKIFRKGNVNRIQ